MLEHGPEALVWELEGLGSCPAPPFSTYVTWGMSVALSDLRFLFIKWESCLFYLLSRYVCNLKNSVYAEVIDRKALEKEGMHSVRWHEDWESLLSLSHRPTLFPLLPSHAQTESGHRGSPGMESSLAGASTGKTEDGKV